MTRLEKLNNELRKCNLEINKLYERQKKLEDEKKLEEQREILKLLKAKNLTLEDLKKLLD